MRHHLAAVTFGGALFAFFASACSATDSDDGMKAGTGGSAGSVSGGAPSSGGASVGGAPAGGTGGSLTGGAPSSMGGFGNASAGGATGSSGAGSGGTAASGGTTAGAGGGSAGTTPGGAAGAAGKGGAAGSGGATAGAGGAGGATGGGGAGGASGGAGGGSGGALAKFSFFVTGMDALLELAKSQDGFGGDFRFGEATGLAGADKICAAIAEKSMPGSSQKQWRAFLSTTTVNAIDRIGAGPWYDRLGRVFAMNKAALLAGPRPQGADPLIINDLPIETGQPNHTYKGMVVDNHDTVTGSTKSGTYDSRGSCSDWTSSATGQGPSVGHSWPRNAGNVSSGGHWISDHTTRGCTPGVNLVQNGGGTGTCIGCGGGYGGFYCFANTP